ncbi:autophagy-related protein 22-like protein [Multifurca ochricompacta]|uniref:Autophagy-related protein n=1 Tax=Multifurca ochricompacta TaxID=376703 RepID=A0AAD4M3Q1_9AGAM|nr:autophagy-related protein 22-like protein [Multifurca ochricompacta]
MVDHPSSSLALVSTSKHHKRELWGWLSYAFASEVFVIVSLTLFLPICLEQFARDNGFLLPDKTTPCISLSAPPTTEEDEARCVVKLGWAWIDTASFSLYTYSASVALQALIVISMGGIADRASYRKPLLFGFAMLGSFSSLCFFLLSSSSPIWPLSGLLAILANIGFGASIVLLNAYLPRLAASSLPSSDRGDAVKLSRATARISSLGIALGYTAGILLLLVTLLPVQYAGGSTNALRFAIGGSGAWWALFSIPAVILLPGASRLEVATGFVVTDEHEGLLSSEAPETLPVVVAELTVWREITDAWRRLGSMLRWHNIRRLRNTFRYLAAWFLLSDGFTTLTSTALLFAKTTLHMPPSSLVLVGVLTPSAGILGALLWPVVQRRLRLTSLRVLILLVVAASVIPLYGVIGLFAPRGARWGLRVPEEMFVLAVYFGALYGAFQSYARALYAEIIPPGEEARWYGLYSITDKSSSFIGPLVVGLVADMTGNIRYAFLFLVFMLWAALPVLIGVDVERGRADALAWSSGNEGHEREGNAVAQQEGD